MPHRVLDQVQFEVNRGRGLDLGNGVRCMNCAGCERLSHSVGIFAVVAGEEVGFQRFPQTDITRRLQIAVGMGTWG